MLGITYGLLFIENTTLKYPNPEKILSASEALVKEEFEVINQMDLFGEQGFFEIFDEQNQMIYSSNPEMSNYIFRPEDIYLLKDYFSSQYTYRSNLTAENTDETSYIEITSYDEETQQVELQGYLLLDENNQVIEDTVGYGKLSYTDIELNILLGIDSFHEGLFLYKYQFVNWDNETFTMVMHVDEIDETYFQKYETLYSFQLPVFIICYILIIIVFVIWMNQKVKRPLDQLQRAMLDLAEGNKEGKLEYKGTLEFAEIASSFNLMSEKLDISEKKKQQLMEEKQKIIADISHDLRTPITVIQGYAKAIQDGLIPEQEKEKYLNIIYQKSNNLAELIQIFYDYSRLEHPDFIYQMEEVDICEFTREYLATKYDEIIAANLTLEVEIPTEKIMILMDKIQIIRVFDNIVNNTLKYHKIGTRILFLITKTDTGVMIQILDNGIGIPKEIQEQLFEPFTVGDDSRSTKEGSGLGLAIAKKIILSHGGSIQSIPCEREDFTTEIKITLSYT